jgi:hypothetical protein
MIAVIQNLNKFHFFQKKNPPNFKLILIIIPRAKRRLRWLKTEEDYEEERLEKERREKMIREKAEREERKRNKNDGKKK